MIFVNELYARTVLPIWADPRRRVPVFFRQSAFDDGANSFYQAFPTAEISRLDWRMENHLHFAGFNCEAGFWHRVVGAGDRDRDYGDPAFHRQIKWPFFEG